MSSRQPDPLTAPLRDVERAYGPPPALVGRARPPALLVLEDGRTFRGEAYGHVGEAYGEAVFTTAMTGYQETLTDPSYHRQVVVMTAPHIGNTGVNDDDRESGRMWAAGVVVRDPARVPSNFRSKRGLDVELARQRVVGVTGVDTRALTRHIRERGAMRVGVSSVEPDADALAARVAATPGMVGADLAPEVTTKQPYVVAADGRPRLRVVALDLGMKASMPRHLARLGIETRVLPATATGDDLLAERPDGVLLSNGPGDPAAATYAVAATRAVLDAGVPVFGICYGHQVLGRALGLRTYKLGYGHRGVNQPVRDTRTGRVRVTSHNHGFALRWPGAVDAPTETPYGRVRAAHVALNDGVVEGVSCADVPAFSVQFHPEAAPGPHDAADLLARFADLMTARR